MFNIDFNIYGFFIALSFLANVLILIYLYSKYNYSKEEKIGLVIYESFGMLFGAKIFTYLSNYSIYKGKDLLSVGLSSYGAVIGAIVSIVFFAIQFKKSFKELLYIHMPSIPLMYAIGKIGCFLVGCCHGVRYDGIGSITYNYSLSAPHSVSFFPVQIIESLFFIMIFIYSFSKTKKEQFNLRTIAYTFIFCGFSKFILDFLRISHLGKILSINQIVSLFFILLGVFLLVFEKQINYNKENNNK